MTDINTVNNRISRINQTSVNEILRKNETGAGFSTLLKEQLDKNKAAQSNSLQSSPLHFSKHAQERIGQRGIEISEKLMDNLEQAVSKARDKGARDIVVIDVSGAFVVNVPNNTVITTMTGSEMKDNIFTNIDSAVLI